MAKMVSAGAFKRVYSLLERTKGTVVFGGQTDEATKAIAPTVVKDCTFEDSLMSECVIRSFLDVKVLMANAERYLVPSCLSSRSNLWTRASPT